MKKIYILLLFVLSGLLLNAESKPKYMWIDCEANYQRMGSVDSIRFYLNKIKEIGFTDVVMDVKSIMGEVLYKSKLAPFMGEWDGHYRDCGFDMMEVVLKEGKKLGLKIHASLNIFAGGHNFYNRGVLYKMYPQWQSIVYWEGELMPITQMKWNYNCMMNPANPEVQRYQLNILKEFASKYKKIDGIILDRMRFDNITSDFSPLSQKLFQEYSNIEVENFPDDILYWVKDDQGKMNYKTGKLFKEWSEWRAMVIRDFMEKARETIKGVNKKIDVGVYTGAWYPTYYYVGVNFTSKKYDPSKEFWWATENYKNTGYAELMDYYMTGLYYTTVTKEDSDKKTGNIGRRDEPGMDNSRSYWYTVEGGSELVKEITAGVVPVIGSLYVEQYEGDKELFGRAVKQALKSNDGGLMIFDMSHIVTRGWWDVIENNIK